MAAPETSGTPGSPAGIVECVADAEVVRCIDHHGGACNESGEFRFTEIGMNRLHRCVRIQRTQGRGCRSYLAVTDGRLLMHDLALQVRQFDIIVIDEYQSSDAGGSADTERPGSRDHPDR